MVRQMMALHSILWDRGDDMIYVFLDVDGVLNKESDWKNKFYLDISCVKVFGELCRELGKLYGEVRTVLISTWRAGISKSGTDAKQIGRLEECLAKEGIRIYGTTPISEKGRQAEVEYYIRRNHVSKYIVIDDDLSLFSEPEKLKLFVPDYRTGLVQGNIKKIVKLLKLK